MATIGNIVANLAVDSSKWSNGLKTGQKNVQSFASKAKKSLSSVTKVAAGVTAGFATLAAAKITGGIFEGLDKIDKLAKTADKLGITTNALAELRHAAELTGAGADVLDNGLVKMVKSISEATTGTGIAVNALNELGLSAEALNSLSPDKQFSSIADAMKDIQNPADKLRLTFQLFGKEGTKLVNTLADGSNGLEQMANDARMLGLSVDRLDASAVEKANDAVYRMNSLLDGTIQRWTVGLAPVITATSQTMIELFSDSASGAGDLANGFDQIAEGVGIAADGLHYFYSAFKGLQGLVTGGLALWTKGLAVFGGALETILNAIPGVAVDLTSTLDEVGKDLMKLSKEQLSVSGDLFSGPLPSEKLKANYQKALADVANIKESIIVPDDFALPLQDAANAIDWAAAGDSLMGMVQGAGDWLGEAMKGKQSEPASAPSTVLKNSKEYFQLISGAGQGNAQQKQLDATKQTNQKLDKMNNSMMDLLVKVGAPQAMNFLNLGT